MQLRKFEPSSPWSADRTKADCVIGCGIHLENREVESESTGRGGRKSVGDVDDPGDRCLVTAQNGWVVVVGRSSHEGSRELPLLTEHGAKVLVIDAEYDAFLEKKLVAAGHQGHPFREGRMPGQSDCGRTEERS